MKKHHDLLPIITPPPGTPFQYNHMTVNLYRHWKETAPRLLPLDYSSLPRPRIDKAHPKTRKQGPKLPKPESPKGGRQPSIKTKDKFYASWEWRTLRMKVLKEFGAVCQCCGAHPGGLTVGGHPVKIVVDHIKPISKYWHMRLERTNLQILCDECNQGKGAWDETDHRPKHANDDIGTDPLILEQLRHSV